MGFSALRRMRAAASTICILAVNAERPPTFLYQGRLRMRYRGFLTFLAPVILVACGGDDYDAGYVLLPPGTYATLQVVNTSVDSPPMDVILDGEPFVRRLDYGQGTGEQPITPARILWSFRSKPPARRPRPRPNHARRHREHGLRRGG